MAITLEIDGAEDFARLPATGQRIEALLRAEIRAVAREYRERLIADLSRQGTGRLYGPL